MSVSVSSHSNSSSPERKCLGGLMKDIDGDSPREDSKDETAYKTLSEQKLSLDSVYPLENIEKKLNINNSNNSTNSPIFNLSTIISAFKSQKTTIILQKSLNDMSKENLDGIIQEMKGYFSAIIKNKNGNYFCSDLLKVCSKEQRIEILKEIGINLIDDCTDEYGTHPIQTLIELANSEEEYKLLLLEKYRMEFNLIFVKFICILAMDMYGVCTAIKFINYTKNEIIEKQLLNIILSNFVNIAENQYGNYLIQNIMEKWWNTNKGIFLKKICMEKFHKLARNHYSSYVCDIFLKLSNLQDKKILMNMLIKYKTINSFDNNNCGKIIINKLMNGLKQNNKSAGIKNSKAMNNNDKDNKSQKNQEDNKK